jgi:Ca2+-binding EF-hand superfamily protein
LKQVEEERIKNEAAKKSPAKNKNTKIVERVKLQRFQALFRHLDSDQDGHISSQMIDITDLSPELLEIMTPLFCELEELGKTHDSEGEPESSTLDIDEFVDALGRLYE